MIMIIIENIAYMIFNFNLIIDPLNITQYQSQIPLRRSRSISKESMHKTIYRETYSLINCRWISYASKTSPSNSKESTSVDFKTQYVNDDFVFQFISFLMIDSMNNSQHTPHIPKIAPVVTLPKDRMLTMIYFLVI